MPHPTKIFFLATALAAASSTAADQAAPAGWLGVASSPIGEVAAAQLDLPEGVGVAVRLILPESPAAKAGLEQHDILFEFDGEPIRSPQHLGELVRPKSAGDTIEFAVIHRGEKGSVAVTIGVRPDHLPAALEGGEPMPGQIDLGDLGALQFKTMPLEGDAQAAADAAKTMQEQLQRQFRGMLKLEGLDNLPAAGEIIGNSAKTMTFSDTSGSISIQRIDGDTKITAKDRNGDILFAGPANTKEDRDKLPPNLRAKLEQFENSTHNLHFQGFGTPDTKMRVPELKRARKVEKDGARTEL